MRVFLLAAVAIAAIVVALTQSASAADSGETQPRVNYGYASAYSYTDIVPTTNGSGNVRGVSCLMYLGNAVLKFYVNGGAAQSVTLDRGYFPVDQDGNNVSGWVPLNIRFTSSIRVQLVGTNGVQQCSVSWALD